MTQLVEPRNQVIKPLAQVLDIRFDEVGDDTCAREPAPFGKAAYDIFVIHPVTIEGR